MSDPRFLIAETYRMLRKHEQLQKEFDNKLNHWVDSPESAIKLCLEYQELANG